MESFTIKNEEIDLIDSKKLYLVGDDSESSKKLNSGFGNQQWFYHVDKGSDNWVVTVQVARTIMLHTSPLFYPCMEYYLLPDTQQLIVLPGQWCEMHLNGYWSVMTDADHR